MNRWIKEGHVVRLPARQASTMIRNIASPFPLLSSFSFFFFFFFFFTSTHNVFVVHFFVRRRFARQSSSVLWIPFYHSILERRFAHPAVCFTALNAFEDFPNDRALLSYSLLHPVFFLSFFHPAPRFCPSSSCEEQVKGRGREEREGRRTFDVK